MMLCEIDICLQPVLNSYSSSSAGIQVLLEQKPPVMYLDGRIYCLIYCKEYICKSISSTIWLQWVFSQKMFWKFPYMLAFKSLQINERLPVTLDRLMFLVVSKSWIKNKLTSFWTWRMAPDESLGSSLLSFNSSEPTVWSRKSTSGISKIENFLQTLGWNNL